MELLSTRDVAKVLGISLATLWRKISAGQIGPRPVKIGRIQRYRPDELQAWIRAGCPGRAQWDAMTKEGGSV